MLVSIVIPAYNAEKFISRCINSILQQTYQKLEIIVIVNGSPNMPAIYNEYFDIDSRLNILHYPAKMFPGKARNIGISFAHGEYICFIDADDWVEKTYIEKLLSAALLNGVPLVICPAIVRYHDENFNVIDSKMLKQYDTKFVCGGGGGLNNEKNDIVQKISINY
jgi:glycosyltransferase involved in cell wall biosynthesis